MKIAWRNAFASAGPERAKMVEQGRAAIIVPQAIKTLRALQDASWIFFDSVETGSRAQTITCDTQGTNDKTRFARVGRTTKPLHEQVHAMQIEKIQSAIGTSAQSLRNIEDAIALP